MFSILITSLSDTRLIFQWEVWLRSLLGLKGLILSPMPITSSLRCTDLTLTCVRVSISPAGFQCLATRGTMVLFGGASGYPDSLEPVLLASGSFSVVHPKLFDYIASTDELQKRAADVFGWLIQGSLKMDDLSVFPLSEAKQAHDSLEGKKTTGKVLLKPWRVWQTTKVVQVDVIGFCVGR